MNVAFARRRRQALPMTSLVDVCFILLFFFMLASQPNAWRTLPIRVAASTPSAAITPQPVWRVALVAGGALMLDGRALTLDALAASACASAKPKVIVVPGAGVSLQEAVRVIDRLRPCGVAAAFGLGST